MDKNYNFFLNYDNDKSSPKYIIHVSNNIWVMGHLKKERKNNAWVKVQKKEKMKIGSLVSIYTYIYISILLNSPIPRLGYTSEETLES